MELNVGTGRFLMGRLKKGDDLLGALERICRDKRIVLGEVRALGAVTCARVGFYDQAARQYLFHEFKEPLEILSLVGNVSLKDGRPFVHAHVTLSGEKGDALGGHLAEGTEVFACEYTIRELTCEKWLERAYDEETGLFLWPQGAG
jgi:uncharacterized protein